LVARKLSIVQALVYIVSEIVGAIIAGLLLISVLPRDIGNAVGWGSPALSQVSVLQGIAFEAIMTFFLVFTVFGTGVDPRAPKIGGFGVGLIVAADVMVGGPFTGAAMNPARAIGPELSWTFLRGSAALTNWYMWWIGPIIGGVLAALVYGYLILERT
jgi:aquaporin TIP